MGLVNSNKIRTFSKLCELIRTYSNIVNKSSLAKLQYIIKTYGEEKHSNIIAKNIINNRPIQNSFHLAEIIRNINRNHPKHIDPSTRTFQAIRIAVNDELQELESTLSQAISVIGLGGRLAVISYHSLEDRIVKKFFQEQSSKCICSIEIIECICNHSPTIKIITIKPITPTTHEKSLNRRSRSAKLRIAERI